MRDIVRHAAHASGASDTQSHKLRNREGAHARGGVRINRQGDIPPMVLSRSALLELKERRRVLQHGIRLFSLRKMTKAG